MHTLLYESHDLRIKHIQNASSAATMQVHPYYSLIYLPVADGYYHIEGYRYPVSSGAILLLQPSEAYLAHLQSTHEQFLIQFTENVLRKNIPSMHLQLTEDYHNFFKMLFSQLLSSASTIGTSVLTIALSLLIDHHFPVISSKNLSYSIQPLIQYINQNLSTTLSITDLCKQFNLTEPHLAHRFKQITGTTPWKYIQTKRLLLARQLIDSGLSAHDACQQSGFADYSTFYRAFRKFFGASPTK